MLHLDSPQWFALLPVVPALLYFRHRRKRALHPTLSASSLSATRDLRPSWAIRLAGGISGFRLLAVVLLILALTRPQWGTEEVEVITEGVNIILTVDLSESMAALDFRLGGKIVDRLEAVKSVIRDFIARRKGDRIGLVVFGSEAYTQLPLTRDYATIASILSRLEIGAAGKQTAIGDAVGISLKRLADTPSKSNVIILLMDGQSNTGELSPKTAAEIAASKNIKIYTIGVGSRGEAPFLVRDPLFGQRYVYQKVDIDEGTLTEMAEKTGGLYFRAENTEGLERIYETIDGLEKTRAAVKTYADYQDLYPYLLIPGLSLILLFVLLTNTRFLRVP